MTMERVPVFRRAEAADAMPIAALHAASWKKVYRGSLSDAYLDGPVEADRQEVWRERFAHPAQGQIVVLVEEDDRIVGFVCAFADHDTALGSLIDNLHVMPGRTGCGLGRGLMRDIARHLAAAAPDQPVYLSVIEANHGARGFYDRLKGDVVEHFSTIVPDGNDVYVLRITWPSPARLLQAAES